MIDLILERGHLLHQLVGIVLGEPYRDLVEASTSPFMATPP